MGFAPETRVGVVVLSNTFTPTGIDDMGGHLLDQKIPLAEPPKTHREVTGDAKLSTIMLDATNSP
jgi:hypothetical protein